MTKTTNYQLNQWDAGDAIRREDFNADNAKLDAALAANVKALADYQAANAAVLADHQAANAAALADYQAANDAAVAAKAEQSALESGLSAAGTRMSAAETRITALEQGVALVRLGVGTAASASQAVTVSLQNVDMSKYTALLVFVGAPQVNSVTGKLYLCINEQSLLTLKAYNSDSGTMMAWVERVGSDIMGGAFCTSSANTSVSSSSGKLSTAWEDIQSVRVSGTFAAGLFCAFYALKA